MKQFIKSRGFFYGVAIIAVIAIVLVGRQIEQKNKTIEFSQLESSGEPAAPRQAETVIGGSFDLIDHNGERRVDADFLGKYMLVYFGYTFCPDVCPTSLQIITDALDELGEEGKDIVPVFITVDPKRDTVEVMKEYVKFFHPRTVGLTGSEDSIAATAKAYRSYYKIVKDPDAKEGDADGEYLVDHTSITYLMGPDGKFVKHFPHGFSVDKMVLKIREILAKKKG